VSAGRSPSPLLAAALLAALAVSSGACLLIEQYGAPVPDAQDGGGGATGSSSATTSSATGTGATSGAGATSGTGTTSGMETTSSSSGSTSSGTMPWAESFGGASDATGNDVTTDAQGNVYVTGAFQGSIDLGKGPLVSAGGNDVFIGKFDPTGALVFGFNLGDSSDQEGLAIAVDGTGSAVVAGNFQGSIDFGVTTLMSAGDDDVFLAKLDPTGAPVWAKGFGDAAEQQILGRGVALDAGGDVFLAGAFEGSIDFGGGPITAAAEQDAFVAMLDPGGNYRWAHGFGTYSLQDAYAVAVSPSGRVGITGSMASEVDFGSGMLPFGGGSDAFVAIFDLTGTLVWAKAYGDSMNQDGFGIAFDADDDVYVAGTFEGTMDFGAGVLTAVGPGPNLFVAKLSPAGAGLASKAWSDGSSPGFAVTSLAVDPAGDVLLSGSIDGTANFGGGPIASAGATDALLVKLDPGLATVFAQRFGDFNPQVANAVAADPMADILLTGAFAGDIVFDGTSLMSTGGTGVFLAKLSP
jgi:hypothetical protein